jgi:UDP-MurNAc hydroxylase
LTRVRIEFVNHASVILHFGDLHVISDPWIEGTAFDNGWKLLTETRFRYEDFRTITHIWFSHEHPDHFSPSDIRRIASDDRARITVLYKRTSDKKVVSFCRQLGFKQVIELQPRRWFELDREVSVLCCPYHDDSALAVRAGGRTVLNTNDCVIADRKVALPLKRLIGDVDVLLTQFSYASYVGETWEERRRHAEQKYRQMGIQSDVFRPRYVIPFASYVWFCHEENHHMNDAVNRIDDVFHYLLARGQPEPVVLYPSESWEIGGTHNSEASIARYMEEYGKIQQAPLIRSASVDLHTLRGLADAYAQRVNRLSFAWILKLSGAVKPVTIWLTDHGRAVSLSLSGLRDVSVAGLRHADLSMSSEVLSFCLRFDYGVNTTNVNGRFAIISQDGATKWRRFLSVGDALNHGRTDLLALIGSMARRVRRAIRGKVQTIDS